MPSAFGLPPEESERLQLLDDLLWQAACPLCGQGTLRLRGWNDLRGAATAVQGFCERCGARTPLDPTREGFEISWLGGPR